MNSFNEAGYVVVRDVLSKETCKFLARQFNMIRDNVVVSQNLPLELIYSNDSKNQFAFGWYSSYTTESMLELLKPKMESITGKNLYPTYSYGRIYYKNSILPEHVDRQSCQYAATVCLDCDDQPWEIWMRGFNGEDTAVTLYPGDMCVYLGCEIPHWRDEYTGENHLQVFLHYVDADGDYSNLKYDNRKMLGMPRVQN